MRLFQWEETTGPTAATVKLLISRAPCKPQQVPTHQEEQVKPFFFVKKAQVK